MKPEVINTEKFICHLPGYARKPITLLSILLIIVTLAVYWQVSKHQFLNFDDGYYVTENSHVVKGITAKNIIWAFTSVEAANWHPITWLSHLADVHLYGLNPRGHHLTNVVIHTLSALFLFLLLFRLTTGVWQSFFVAALFALHPLHVESVAWIAERKDVLSAFFWFLTLIIYSEYASKRNKSLYILTLVIFVLGLMSKPMLVTLPIIMLLIDFWPLDRYRSEEKKVERGHLSRVIPLVTEKIPFFACSLFSALITIYAQHKGEAIAEIYVVSIRLRFENAILAYIKYIYKTVWPFDLAVYYPFPYSIPSWQVISSFIVLLSITVAVIRTRRHYPYFLVGWLWFLTTLLPVIGIIQVGSQAMADRYSYIPITGLFIMFAWGVPQMMESLPLRKVMLATLACAAISASATLTWLQLGYWRDNVSLYRHTLLVTTDNFFIYNNLGLALADEGELNAAIQIYQQGLKINPDFLDAHNNLALALINIGDMDAASNECWKALRISPSDSSAHNNLGLTLASKGDLDAGIREFKEALRIEPDNAKAHNNLGLALARKGDLETGIREFREALRIRPNDTDTISNLELAEKRRQEAPKLK